MDNHLGILQERIESAAVGTEWALDEAEGIRGETHQREKENLDASQNHGRVGEEAGISFVPEAKDECISGEQEGPEEQRAFLSGPQGCELVGSGKSAVAVVKDVGDGEVVSESGDNQGNGSQDNGAEYDNAGAASGFTEALPVGIAFAKKSNKADYERIRAQRQCEEQGKTTDLRHVEEPHGIFSETHTGGNRSREDWRAR